LIVSRQSAKISGGANSFINLNNREPIHDSGLPIAGKNTCAGNEHILPG